MKKVIFALVGCFALFSCTDPESNTRGSVEPVVPKTKEELWAEWAPRYEEVAHDEILDMEEGFEKLQNLIDEASEVFLTNYELTSDSEFRRFINENTVYFMTDIPRQIRFWEEYIPKVYTKDVSHVQTVLVRPLVKAPKSAADAVYPYDVLNINGIVSYGVHCYSIQFNQEFPGCTMYSSGAYTYDERFQRVNIHYDIPDLPSQFSISQHLL